MNRQPEISPDSPDHPRRNGKTFAAEVAEANDQIRAAYARLPFTGEHAQPVGMVQWVHLDQVKANDYNPNSVAHQEMRLLHTSIAEDGLTQPIVTVADDSTDPPTYVVVDGFHRYTTMKTYPDLREQTGGYVPIVVLDKPLADRMASTIRHNRARGKHSVAGMSNLVFGMLTEGEDDATICRKIGLEAEELARLKHVTGYSKLYADREYSKVTMSTTQIDEKAAYKRAHPEEEIPPW